MAHLNVSFSIQGSGSVELPVTPLDNLIVAVNGLEVATFRFSVENITASVATIDLTSTQTGPDADKVNVDWDLDPFTIEPGVSRVITTTITPIEPLLDGDSLAVAIVGKSV